ncbi:hypothetical protein BD309DRAFT_990961 [Dichomitus squalens]|nr:hypothetical protein BD309DRAFT_990961 [Dichomitus squalens]
MSPSAQLPTQPIVRLGPRYNQEEEKQKGEPVFKSQTKPNAAVQDAPGLPPTCSTPTKRKVKNGCQNLMENDGSLQYTDGWRITTSDPNGLTDTLHFTNTTGASFSLMFNASSIVVFGLVPPGPSPPLASYSIDGSLPVAVHLGATTECIANQQLFSSEPLSGPGPHNLTIFVNQTSSEQPHIIDYLWPCGTN